MSGSTTRNRPIYGMLVAGIPAPEIAQTLGLSAAYLQACLSEMVAKLESLDAARTIARRYARANGGRFSMNGAFPRQALRCDSLGPVSR